MDAGWILCDGNTIDVMVDVGLVLADRQEGTLHGHNSTPQPDQSSSGEEDSVGLPWVYQRAHRWASCLEKTPG